MLPSPTMISLRYLVIILMWRSLVLWLRLMVLSILIVLLWYLGKLDLSLSVLIDLNIVGGKLCRSAS